MQLELQNQRTFVLRQALCDRTIGDVGPHQAISIDCDILGDSIPCIWINSKIDTNISYQLSDTDLTIIQTRILDITRNVRFEERDAHKNFAF